ncbi:MAG: FtsX-like permease family protein, partial [Nocardioides sp.]
MAGWKPALRIARRDALRSKGRSILVLVMIALPVLAVSAADVVYKTSDVNSTESLDRRLGAADARIVVQPGAGRVFQVADPDQSSMTSGGRGGSDDAPTLETIRRVLGRDVPAVQRADGGVRIETDRGVADVGAAELDLSSPLVDGLYRLTEGTWPSGIHQVAVNGALSDKGFGVGSTVTLREGGTLTVTAVAESTTNKSYPTVVGNPGSLGIASTDGSATWLIGGGPVSWADVRALNAVGVLVLSRQVVEHPPPDSELPSELTQYDAPVDDTYIAALALVVVMALLEVVLLAGPAFAVGARRHSRTLALMAASGGTPRQARRVILAGGLVLGATAALLGVALGVALGWALLPVVQHYSDSWLGPFEVEPLHLLGVAAFGLLSAFLAAVVPAWLASRQDVVAVLAGRRGDRRPGYRSPVLGAILLGTGIAMSVAGARGGELLIAAAAVVSVLGMILLVPVVVAVLARFSRRLPLVTRYAVRDAARHRTRTVPAVAAVAATVAGVVALGIANSSDALETERTYQPSMPTGTGWLTVAEQDADYTSYVQTVARVAPSVTTTQVRSYDAYRDDSYFDIRVRRPDVRGYD